MNPHQLLDILKKTLAYDNKFISLHEPYFIGNEWKYVKECLDTGWVSSVGKYVDRFEQDLCAYTGAKYAIAAVNGTAAMHICYQLAGVKAGDEVLVPTLTFIGTINPLLYCGAIPHFIDSEPKFLGLDATTLDDYLKEVSYQENQVCINRYTKRPIRALCVMHTLGHPVDLDALTALCERHHLALIEDAAEALGSFYKGVHVGHKGLVGALSFNGNKIITTGGGGAILTNHEGLAKTAKYLTTTAKRPHPWLFDHDMTGYNYRLPNINSALGCAQLENINHYLQQKRKLAEKYQQVFSAVAEMTFIAEPSYAKSNYWLNAILLDEKYLAMKDEMIALSNQHQVMVRPLWNLQHTLPMHKNFPCMPVTHAENLAARLIKIPSSPQLISERIEQVC